MPNETGRGERKRIMQILVVEDHADTRSALQQYLARGGHEVIVAENLRTGIDRERHRLTGWERLRAHQRSAQAREQSAQHCVFRLRISKRCR